VYNEGSWSVNWNRLKTLLENCLQPLIQFGISLIIALQSAGDWPIPAMRFFSYLGTEDFFFLVLPLVYWCVDSALGLRIGFILLTSSMFNFVGKLLFASPRPYWISAHVRALWPEATFGMPSGHAQEAAAVWGIIAAYAKRFWIWVASILLIFLIGFSRIYLGSHFPQDVIVGWVMGALIVWAFSHFWETAAAWIGSKPLNHQIFIAFAVSLVFVMLGLGAVALQSTYQIPDAWMNNAFLVATKLPAPLEAHGIFTVAGTFFGLAVGAAWILSLGGYEAAGSLEKRALRYPVGLMGILLFWMGLGAVLPDGDGFIFDTLRFLRYTLVGWWVAGGAPWVFMRIRLAQYANKRT
jgi:membrane-associated phospholipid phosphatase